MISMGDNHLFEDEFYTEKENIPGSDHQSQLWHENHRSLGPTPRDSVLPAYENFLCF